MWSYELVDPDDFGRVTAAHRDVQNGVATTVTYRIQGKRGGYRWVETMSRAVLADGDHGDVTEIVCSTRALEGRGVIAHVAGAEDTMRLEKVQKILADEDIAPVFQPIVELGTGRVVAYEGLARFPDHQSRPPDRWFADAWQVGLGIPLELLAVRAVCGALPASPLTSGSPSTHRPPPSPRRRSSSASAPRPIGSPWNSPSISTSTSTRSCRRRWPGSTRRDARRRSTTSAPGSPASGTSSGSGRTGSSSMSH